MRRKKNGISSIQEDYLEAIYEIIVIEDNVAAKVTDIAHKLEVNKSNVSNMMKVLGQGGYVDYNTYRWITLTEKGSKQAEKIYKRHLELITFFNDILGLDETVSEENACRIEHAIDSRAMQRLRKLCRYLNKKGNLTYNKKTGKFICQA